jgi:hypothetical protein
LQGAAELALVEVLALAEGEDADRVGRVDQDVGDEVGSYGQAIEY